MAVIKQQIINSKYQQIMLQKGYLEGGKMQHLLCDWTYKTADVACQLDLYGTVPVCVAIATECSTVGCRTNWKPTTAS